jgi:hypothetical protein
VIEVTSDADKGTEFIIDLPAGRHPELRAGSLFTGEPHEEE